MARETKVGLLAGLAFIICFAVILANRGANSTPAAANAFLPNGGLELPKLMQRKQATTPEATPNPGKVARKPTITTTPRNGTQMARNSAGQTSAPLAANEAVAGTGTQLSLDAVVQPPAPSADSILALNTRPVDQAMNPDAGLERALTSPSPTSAPQRTDPPVSMTATLPISDQPNIIPARISQSEPPAAQPAPSPIVQGTSYTVKPSDTLSSIAAAHFGTKSKKTVEAIYEANRGVLPNMNNLKVGMVLTIPKLASAAAERTQLAEKPHPVAKIALASDKVANTKTKDAEKPPSKKEGEKKPARKAEQAAETPKSSSNFKWYQVKKNDRFASIAREQLGDPGRWHELYEMNKDKFPNPQHIREGVRIKLPLTESLASAGKEKEKTR